MGQFKSKITCPDCGKVSITMDPFLTWSLPIPSTKPKILTYRVLMIMVREDEEKERRRMEEEGGRMKDNQEGERKSMEEEKEEWKENGGGRRENGGGRRGEGGERKNERGVGWQREEEVGGIATAGELKKKLAREMRVEEERLRWRIVGGREIIEVNDKMTLKVRKIKDFIFFLFLY